MYVPKYPAKSAEELKWIDRLVEKLDALVQEDQQNMMNQAQLQDDLKEKTTHKKPVDPIDELEEIYAKPTWEKEIEQRRNMSQKEKKALAKDDIDLIDTSDVENAYTNMEAKDFMIRH